MRDHGEYINPITGEIDTAGLIAAYDERCEEVAALEFKTKQGARSELALRRELSKQHADDPHSHQIREVMEYWLAKCHKSSRTKIPLDGIRAQKVRARLNQDFTVDDLKLAVDGCALKPFVGPRGRAAKQEPGCRREDDLELILRDEKNVERFQGYAKEVRQTERPALAVVDEPEDAGGTIIVDTEIEGEWIKYPVPVSEQRQRQHERRLAERAEHARIFGDQRPPIHRVIEAARATTGHSPVPAPGVGANDSWMTICPSHEDRSPSLRISRSPEGTVLLYCLAGCDNDQIVRDFGLMWRDLWDCSHLDENAEDYWRRPAAGPTRERKQELADALRQIQQTLISWEKEAA